MRLRIRRIADISPTHTDKKNYGQMIVQVEMTEDQMLDAVLEFLTEVSGETWNKWLEIIEKETT